MTKGFLLERLSWPQARAAFQKTSFVVIPSGSTEQHGPHLPLGTDFMAARELAARLAARAEVIVTPTLPFGFAKYHTVFPGTLSLTDATLGQVLIELCEDLLKYGASHILFVNGHGGNAGAIRRCGDWLRQRAIPMAAAPWWEMTHLVDTNWRAIGHADYIETAAMLAIDAELVDLQKARNHPNNQLSPDLPATSLNLTHFKGFDMAVNNVVSDVNSAGNMLEIGMTAAKDYTIEPTTATPEMGEKILDGLADYLAEFVEAFRKVTYPPVGLVSTEE